MGKGGKWNLLPSYLPSPTPQLILSNTNPSKTPLQTPIRCLLFRFGFWALSGCEMHLFFLFPHTAQIDGSAVFDVCVKDMMPADVPEHFRGTVNIWATVISSDGSKQVTFDDSTPVQKQLIDIKYTKDTRKQFKPGLPYKGKVRLKVEPWTWLI